MGRAFNTIIAELSKQPQLHLPDASKPFVIFTDASDVAKGPMLEQDGHPIAFDSSSLNKHEKNYDLRQKELLAIVRACRRWRHYLACVPVTVYTDHRTLTTFLDNHDLTDTTGRLCRWQEFCPMLTSPSSTNLTRTTRQRMRSADSHRSRSQWQPRQQRPQRSGTCRPRSWMRFAPLTPRTLTSKTSSNHLTTGATPPPLRALRVSLPYYQLHDGLLYRKSAANDAMLLYLPDCDARTVILTHIHATELCHLAAAATLHRVAGRFYVPRASKVVHALCRRCPECIASKSLNFTYGPLQPLPAPNAPFSAM